MVGATESAPRESGSLRRAGLRCMLMSVERSCVPLVDSRDDPVTLVIVAHPLLYSYAYRYVSVTGSLRESTTNTRDRPMDISIHLSPAQ
jgi:hypothetical protein